MAQKDTLFAFGGIFEEIDEDSNKPIKVYNNKLFKFSSSWYPVFVDNQRDIEAVNLPAGCC